MLGTRTKSEREKVLLYHHQDTTAGPSDFRKIKLHRRTVLCYYSRKCRWHRPKTSKIKFIKIMDIRINRKSELSYMLKWTLNPESFTGECIWTRGHSWNTHTCTHTYQAYTSLRREGRRKEGHTPQNISLCQKNLRPNGDMETTKWENLRKLFFPGFCFPKQTFTKRIYQ